MKNINLKLNERKLVMNKNHFLLIMLGTSGFYYEDDESLPFNRMASVGKRIYANVNDTSAGARSVANNAPMMIGTSDIVDEKFLPVMYSTENLHEPHMVISKSKLVRHRNPRVRYFPSLGVLKAQNKELLGLEYKEGKKEKNEDQFDTRMMPLRENIIVPIQYKKPKNRPAKKLKTLFKNVRTEKELSVSEYHIHPHHPPKGAIKNDKDMWGHNRSQKHGNKAHSMVPISLGVMPSGVDIVSGGLGIGAVPQTHEYPPVTTIISQKDLL